MLGIFFGLVLGKPLGIALFSLLAIKFGLSSLPEGISTGHLLGAGFLGGIGFTMAIFVTFLAFGDTVIAQDSKLAVLLGSILAGLLGFFILKAQRTQT
jgi:NhaA family Na+:H+ antiporter